MFGALTGRLASRYSATGQTNLRIQTEPIRQRTQCPILKPRSIPLRFQNRTFSAKGIQADEENESATTIHPAIANEA
jgi:hypothetical protein